MIKLIIAFSLSLLLAGAPALADGSGIYNPSANAIGDYQGIDSNAAASGSTPFAVTSVCNSSAGASSATWNASCAMGTVPASSTLVVSFGMQNPPQTVTSVIYDPSGANITLAQQVYGNSGGSSMSLGFWSGVIPAGSGTKTIQINTSNTMATLAVGMEAWLITGNVSSTAVASSATIGATDSISVIAGEILLGSTITPSAQAWSFSGSTPVAPSSTIGSGSNIGGAQWNPNITTTATYTVSVTPSPWYTIAATFH